MANEGLVKRYIQPNSPRDRWQLTPKGVEIISHFKVKAETEHQHILNPLGLD